jgi:hypothetical protein
MEYAVRMMTARTQGFKNPGQQAVGFAVLVGWEQPTAVNDEKFGEPDPHAPKPKVKPKLNVRYGR